MKIVLKSVSNKLFLFEYEILVDEWDLIKQKKSNSIFIIFLMKSRRKQESHNSTLSDILSKNKLSDEIVLYIVQLPENAELLKSFQPNNNFGLKEILKIL